MVSCSVWPKKVDMVGVNLLHWPQASSLRKTDKMVTIIITDIICSLVLTILLQILSPSRSISTLFKQKFPLRHMRIMTCCASFLNRITMNSIRKHRRLLVAVKTEFLRTSHQEIFKLGIMGIMTEDTSPRSERPMYPLRLHLKRMAAIAQFFPGEYEPVAHTRLMAD